VFALLVQGYRGDEFLMVDRLVWKEPQGMTNAEQIGKELK
jgi:hypothetical protein